MNVGSNSKCSVVSSNNESCKPPIPSFGLKCMFNACNFFTRKSRSFSCVSWYSGWNFRMAAVMVRRSNGVATPLEVAHNFELRDIHVQVWETAGNYDQVYPDLELPDTNTARLRFLTPPTNGYAYRVVVIGR